MHLGPLCNHSLLGVCWGVCYAHQVSCPIEDIFLRFLLLITSVLVPLVVIGHSYFFLKLLGASCSLCDSCSRLWDSASLALSNSISLFRLMPVYQLCFSGCSFRVWKSTNLVLVFMSYRSCSVTFHSCVKAPPPVIWGVLTFPVNLRNADSCETSECSGIASVVVLVVCVF